MGRYPLCPGTSLPHGLNAASPSLLANGFWQQHGKDLLPTPHANIAPGYAITGNRAYLETGSPSRQTFTHTTPLGDLTISAQGTFYVDWGDGTPRSGPFDTPGGPYPNGSITHVWDDTGRYTVTVTEQWTATWSLAGQSGTLTGLQTTGALPDFEVRQLESVRNR